MLFEYKGAIIGKLFFAFSNGKVIIVGTRRFQVEEVSPLACLYPLRKNFIAVISIFHGTKNLSNNSSFLVTMHNIQRLNKKKAISCPFVFS